MLAGRSLQNYLFINMSSEYPSLPANTEASTLTKKNLNATVEESEESPSELIKSKDVERHEKAEDPNESQAKSSTEVDSDPPATDSQNTTDNKTRNDSAPSDVKESSEKNASQEPAQSSYAGRQAQRKNDVHRQRAEEVLKKTTPYEVLDINRNCTTDDAKRAWKKAILKIHPDKNPSIFANDAWHCASLSYPVILCSS